MRTRFSQFVLCVLLAALILSCGLADLAETDESTAPQATTAAAENDSSTPPTTPPPAISSSDEWDLWVDGPHLRGADIYQRRVYPELDGPEFMGSGPVGPPYSQADFDRLAEPGANYVNISHPGLFSEEPPFELDQEIQAHLDQLLDMIARADMFAVISFRTGPGRSEFTFFWDEVGDWFDEGYINDSLWQDPTAQDAWVEMWRHTAERYRDNPIVVGYDLMVEPNSNDVGSDPINDLLDIWEPDEFYAQYAGSLYDWNQLHPRIAAAVRQADPDTPILVGGNGYSGVAWLPYLEPTGVERTVYAAHQYEPFLYTHQWWEDIEYSYPGMIDIDWDGEAEQFGRDQLDELLSALDEFAAEHHSPMAVNEFGVVRWVPGAAEFMDDMIDLLEERGINYALWNWDPGWEPWVEEVNAFNFRLGPDPEDTRDVDSELQQVITDHWALNAVRPSSFAAQPLEQPPDTPQLGQVTHWLYLIDVDLAESTVEQIVASEHDLVVLDFIPSEEYNTDYPMAETLARLHNAPHPKLVLAYIDIAEAEEYRTYWQPGWRVGDPAWIVGEDPDGWAENYPVAYWYDEWQEIWESRDGILQQILDADFDGVYLDWIEAYSDENIIAMAEEEDLDPLQEMIWWGEDISAFVKRRCAECLVVAQNAAELAEYTDYREAIDAIAQEQVWFDGGADNDPPGDCPLPRTEAEVDTPTYRASLSPACRRQYDEYPESTLHVSSEEYLHYLIRAQRAGLPILTVDYALEPDNIAWVYATSREFGFIPFVSNRGLDQYIEPWP
jgi:uncharacterized protein (TIGR01370 family)